jgi:hypothetical protein
MIISGKTKNKKKFFVQNTDGDILLKDHAMGGLQRFTAKYTKRLL